MKVYFKGQSLSGGSSSDGGTSEEVYSFEETRIGTWVTGKPLYRKVISIISPSNADTGYVVADPIENVYQVVDLRGVIVSAGAFHPVNSYHYSGAGSNLTTTYQPAGVVMQCGSGMVGKPGYVILEYTKKTDL